MPLQIMAHLVAGFPEREGFLQALRGLKDGGADILELQIPFSDPTADGPVITRACEKALSSGFHVCDIFDYIAEARRIGFDRILVMTYANIAFQYGVAAYVADLKAAGVEAALIPDFPLEDEEGFYAAAFECGLSPVPVVVINMAPDRFALLKAKPFSKVYVAIRSGITGQETEITNGVRSFLDSLSAYERFAGFGIRTAEQIRSLAPHTDVVVVGSCFTATIHAACTGQQSIYNAVKARMKILSEGKLE